MLVAEFIRRDERILVGPDVVITVRPILNAAAAIEARFRRQGRPADIILVRAPRDPGRRPFVSRHPNPPDFAQPKPAPVVIGRPAKRLVGNPGPPSVAIDPATFGVRPPVARLFRFARLPDVTVIARLAPLAVGIELLVKHSVSRGGSFFGASFGSFGNNRRGRRGDRLFHRRRRRSCGGFPISQRFLTCRETGLILRETLFLRLHSLGGETILHLPLDLGLSFFFGLLFLAGNEKRQGSDQRENGKLLHGVVRQGWCWVIRWNDAGRLSEPEAATRMESATRE